MASVATPDSSWTVPATSAHPGGVNVTMADGHVQFIKNTISRPTWWAISTKANGEVVSSDCLLSRTRRCA